MSCTRYGSLAVEYPVPTSWSMYSTWPRLDQECGLLSNLVELPTKDIGPLPPVSPSKDEQPGPPLSQTSLVSLHIFGGWC